MFTNIHRISVNLLNNLMTQVLLSILFLQGRSHSYSVVQLGFKPRQSDSRSCALNHKAITPSFWAGLWGRKN